jgi:hypothetical protein
VPDDLDAVESAPLLCAGVATFNALRIPESRASRRRLERPKPRPSPLARGAAALPEQATARSLPF